MAKMQELGIERARFTLQAVLHKGRPSDIKITHRLYFRKLDGPNSQVLDDTDLKGLETRLQPELDDPALSRASKAPIFRGFREFPRLPSFKRLKNLECEVEFLATPWLSEQSVHWFASAKSMDPLTRAVIESDAAETRIVLESHRFSKSELSSALVYAANSLYDNSAVIALLIQAGADPNIRSSDGITPLMVAVGHPCNLPPLLQGGANPNLQDKWGRTAFSISKWQKNIVAMTLLEKAGATEK